MNKFILVLVILGIFCLSSCAEFLGALIGTALQPSSCPEYEKGSFYLNVKLTKTSKEKAIIYLYRKHDCFNKSEEGADIKINNQKIATLYGYNFTILEIPAGEYKFSSSINFTLRSYPASWKVGYEEYQKSKNLNITIEQSDKLQFSAGKIYYIKWYLTEKNLGVIKGFKNMGTEEEIKKSGQNRIFDIFSSLKRSTFVEANIFKVPYEISEEEVPVSLFDYKAWNEEVKKSNYFNE